MKILLINPPHTAIGSRIPVEHLPPLGLLSIGGPLIDAGHDVELLDADYDPMPLQDIVDTARRINPDALLIGHSGSTTVHPTVVELVKLIHQVLPDKWIIYGGVYPTYHWREVLQEAPEIDVIVRGEGEATTPKLIKALENGCLLTTIAGLAYRDRYDQAIATASAPMIELDDYRVGWELIDFKKYSYWGERQAVVVQFSRGCPHLCNYCGQRGFWTRWRHRDPEKFAAELAWLHREHGVEVVNFADENPTSSRRAWKAFLEALIAEDVDLTIVASTRADDIVRDADILHLYKKAGVARFLLGMESYDEATLELIKKGGSVSKDKQAIQLLRQHNILSMATWVVGFEEETHRDYWRGLKQLLDYDPDQIQMLYVTPHRWTPFYTLVVDRRVIQPDLRKWDYKHQVLATKNMSPWMVLLWVKTIEMIMQMRPRSLLRYFTYPDRAVRKSIHWYYRIGRKVWPYEILNFLFRDEHLQDGPTLEEFQGAPQEQEEEALKRVPKRKRCEGECDQPQLDRIIQRFNNVA